MNNQIKRFYECPICQKNHEILLSKDLSENRDHYPFSYVLLHRYESEENLEESGMDILTTLYLDCDLNVRGVEAVKLNTTEIISKEDSAEIIQKLMNYIEEQQKNYDELFQKYNELKSN
jgi:DNA mismatch repair ATPase MutS